MNIKNIKIYRQLLGRTSAAKIRWLNFDGVDFSKIDFEDVDFSKIDSSYASFRYADFENANFENANFNGMCTTQTNFYNARFSGVILKNITLSNGSVVKKYKVFEKLYSYPVFAYITEGESVVRMGCFERTVKEWESDFWNNDNEFGVDEIEARELRKNAFETAKKWIKENK